MDHKKNSELLLFLKYEEIKLNQTSAQTHFFPSPSNIIISPQSYLEIRSARRIQPAPRVPTLTRGPRTKSAPRQTLSEESTRLQVEIPGHVSIAPSGPPLAAPGAHLHRPWPIFPRLHLRRAPPLAGFPD